MLTGLLKAAEQDSRTRSAATRAHLKRTLRGPALRAALASAKVKAKADLAGARAEIRRNHALLRGGKRRKKGRGLLVPKSG